MMSDFFLPLGGVETTDVNDVLHNSGLDLVRSNSWEGNYEMVQNKLSIVKAKDNSVSWGQ